jgi:hypothetical protein
MKDLYKATLIHHNLPSQAAFVVVAMWDSGQAGLQEENNTQLVR